MRWSWSRRSYSDLSAMIAIAGRGSRSRHDFETFPRSPGQDCDPGDKIAIAAALSLSRRGDRDRGEVIAIISAMIVIATRFWKIVSEMSGWGFRSCRWNRNRSGIVLITGWWLRSRRDLVTSHHPSYHPLQLRSFERELWKYQYQVFIIQG